MPTAVLFPGQGSQQPAMRGLVAAEAPELLDRCLALMGEDPFERVGESTRYAQPAIFCASIAGWRRHAPELRDCVAFAGHSLGEFAALVAAGALDLDDALRLVVLRGRLMAEAGGGTMLALLGADDAAAEALAERHAVTVANLNAPGQVVLSGPAGRLRAVTADARAAGLRTLELGVAGAFHSPAMRPAVAPFAEELARVRFRPTRAPVMCGHTAAPMTDPARELAEAIAEPVRWSATMRALADRGVADFVDVGPGRVLAKLVRRNLEVAHV